MPHSNKPYPTYESSCCGAPVRIEDQKVKYYCEECGEPCIARKKKLLMTPPQQESPDKDELREKIRMLDVYQAATNALRRGGTNEDTLRRFQANWELHIEQLLASSSSKVEQDDIIDDLIQSAVAQATREAEDKTHKIYEKELNYWKNLAESYVKREQLKIEPAPIVVENDLQNVMNIPSSPQGIKRRLTILEGAQNQNL